MTKGLAGQLKVLSSLTSKRVLRMEGLAGRTAAGRFHILKFKANLGAGNLAGRQTQGKRDAESGGIPDANAVSGMHRLGDRRTQGKEDAESGCIQEVNTVSWMSSLASVKGWNKGQQHCTIVHLWKLGICMRMVPR